ncbi:Cobalt/magnesium transport protein CorA [uncultured archaeon]|nr:Cobalt/magnesium transport protein CorA [uncultured archaeon]
MISEYKLKEGILLDCVQPQKEDLEKISKQLRIDVESLRGKLDFSSRPKVTRKGDFSIISFSAPYRKEKQEKTTTIYIIYSKKVVIVIRKHEVVSLKTLQTWSKKGKNSEVLAIILEKVLAEYFERMELIDEEIESIEGEIVLKPTKKSVQKIFELKKQLIFFHKAFSADREVLLSITRDSSLGLTKQEIENFQEVYSETVQLIDLEEIYRDILTNNLDMYISSISNNLNSIMKTLTIIMSFFMAPALIAGIYGMNFRQSPTNMPELYWNYGYFWALGLMVLTIVGLYIFFKKKGWIEKRDLT